MSKKFQCKAIPNTWIEESGTRRLDSGPYLSGAIEAKLLLEKISTNQLSEVIDEDAGGIVISPYFKRVYIEDDEHSIRLLGNTDILMPEFICADRLARTIFDTYGDGLKLIEGSTLITCFGTVGRMAYCRKDMASCAASTNFMRIIPDSKKITPGYLFAFLSSKYGVPIVTQNETGTVIPNLLPSNLISMPIPRLGDTEFEVNTLIKHSSDALVESADLLKNATELLLDGASLKEVNNGEFKSDNRRLGWAQSNITAFSLRALNYDPRAMGLWKTLESRPHNILGNLIDRSKFEGHIVFKRIDAEPEYAALLIGQREAFQLRPVGRWISRKSIENLGLIVPEGTTVIPCHGTLGETELYCRAAFVTRRTANYAYSGDFYRCIPKDGAIAAGYLYAFLRSDIAFRILRAISTGSKQQYQHPVLMANMPIPRLDSEQEVEIAETVDRAGHLRDYALDLEDKARTLVERAIEEGGR